MTSLFPPHPLGRVREGRWFFRCLCWQYGAETFWAKFRIVRAMFRAARENPGLDAEGIYHDASLILGPVGVSEYWAMKEAAA